MNSTTVGIVTIASGVAIGAAVLYSINKGIEFEKVIKKFEENKEAFLTLVKNLIDLGRDFLIRLYNNIVELVKELIFKYKVNTSY